MFNYHEAFACNLGLLNEAQLETLRGARVAIAGMGAVGGEYALSFARSGIGALTIADFDSFELKNFNRQCGAMMSTLHRPKAAVMAAMAKDINPEIDLRSMEVGIGPETVDTFLEDANVVVDAMDIFEPDAHRLLIQTAVARGLIVLAALPAGFGAGLVVFSPRGMPFDRYFDYRPDLSEEEKTLRLLMGLAPASYHMQYLDPASVDLARRKGPSSVAGVKLCAGLVVAQTLVALLNPDRVRSAPWYTHMDAKLCRMKHKRLWRGNRHPVQMLKRRIAVKILANRSAARPLSSGSYERNASCQ